MGWARRRHCRNRLKVNISQRDDEFTRGALRKLSKLLAPRRSDKGSEGSSPSSGPDVTKVAERRASSHSPLKRSRVADRGAKGSSELGGSGEAQGEARYPRRSAGWFMVLFGLLPRKCMIFVPGTDGRYVVARHTQRNFSAAPLRARGCR